MTRSLSWRGRLRINLAMQILQTEFIIPTVIKHILLATESEESRTQFLMTYIHFSRQKERNSARKSYSFRFIILENYYCYYCRSRFIYTEHISFLLLCSWRTQTQVYFVQNILPWEKVLKKKKPAPHLEMYRNLVWLATRFSRY